MHLSKKLLWDVQKSPVHTLLFDESFNAELQNNQMDVQVRYWCDETDRIQSRYLTSLFMGHGKAENLLHHYEEATKEFDASKKWHIGMDGLNVNLALEKEFKKIRTELNLPSLIELGTCGLETEPFKQGLGQLLKRGIQTFQIFSCHTRGLHYIY